MKKSMVTILFFCMYLAASAQWKQEEIYTPFVLFKERAKLDQNLRENVVEKTFTLPLDSNTEYKYESACWAISQFQIANTEVEKGMQKMLHHYDGLSADTRRALLETIYGNFPLTYEKEIHEIFNRETDPSLFTICALYLFRWDSGMASRNAILIKMTEQFPSADSSMILLELQNYLFHHQANVLGKAPHLDELFAHQARLGRKIIYSLQRWNRNYRGLAIVQYADGKFARHADGRLMIFEQLARSASNLPYFIRNGSTPQGIYSVQGIDIAHNNFIGPTPNLQLIMPFEDKWEKYFFYDEKTKWDTTGNAWAAYQDLLPASWKNYAPMAEVFAAGKLGRTEIIAHGTTIDPVYFRNSPFYPLTPTLGCLCAREEWNITTGRPTLSEQLGLVNAFTAKPGKQGYLYVVNLDNQQKPVTRQEVEYWVTKFERGR